MQLKDVREQITEMTKNEGVDIKVFESQIKVRERQDLSKILCWGFYFSLLVR